LHDHPVTLLLSNDKTPSHRNTVRKDTRLGGAAKIENARNFNVRRFERAAVTAAPASTVRRPDPSAVFAARHKR
jgi:hypothetical protein